MNLMEKYQARLRQEQPEIISQEEDQIRIDARQFLRPFEEDVAQGVTPEQQETRVKKVSYCKNCWVEIIFLQTHLNKKIPVTASTAKEGDIKFDYSRHEPHRFCPKADTNTKIEAPGVERYKPISKERERTLAMCMDASILHYRDQIIKEGRWMPSDATRSAEKRIEEIQRDVMAGHGKLLDFRAACEEWLRTGVTSNETFNNDKEDRHYGFDSKEKKEPSSID